MPLGDTEVGHKVSLWRAIVGSPLISLRFVPFTIASARPPPPCLHALVQVSISLVSATTMLRLDAPPLHIIQQEMIRKFILDGHECSESWRFFQY